MRGAEPGQLLVLGKYLAFQLPGWVAVCVGAFAAHRWFGLGEALAWAAVAVFVLKDFALYPFVRHAYAARPHRPGDHVEGQVGVVEEDVAPRGVVRLGPERWRARLAPGAPALARGEHVRVEAVEGLCLVVRGAQEERNAEETPRA